MKFTHTNRIDGDEYEITADDTRDDGENQGYYGYARRNGKPVRGLVGPHPTPEEAIERMIWRVITDRGDEIP